MRAGIGPDDFWEMDPDETQMFIDAYWWRWEMQDQMQAHYARLQMMPHLGKKPPKTDKIRFLKSKDDQQPEENVISLEERRKAREKLAASLAGRQDKIVSREHRSRKQAQKSG